MKRTVCLRHGPLWLKREKEVRHQHHYLKRAKGRDAETGECGERRARKAKGGERRKHPASPRGQEDEA